MAKEAAEGESEFDESQEARARLRRLLGLESEMNTPWNVTSSTRHLARELDSANPFGMWLDQRNTTNAD